MDFLGWCRRRSIQKSEEHEIDLLQIGEHFASNLQLQNFGQFHQRED